MENKTCPQCKKIYKNRTKFCSRKCYAKSMLGKSKKTLYHKVCDFCKKDFITKQSFSKFCSKECQRKNYLNLHPTKKEKIKKICPVCRSAFIGNSRKKYCSVNCYHKFYYKRINIPEKSCCVCGNKIKAKSRSAKTCSNKCWQKNKLKNMSELEKIEKRKKANIYYHKKNIRCVILKKCCFCGVDYKTLNKKQIYCSSSCSTKKYRSKDDVKIMRTIESQKRQRHKKDSFNNFTYLDWLFCVNYFNNKCAYCGKYFKKLQQDHYYPFKLGGKYIKTNIVPSCNSCNSSKNCKKPKEWIKKKFLNANEIISNIEKYFLIVK